MKNNDFMISVAKKNNEIVFSGYLPDHNPNFSWLLLPIIFWSIILIIDSRLLTRKIDKKKH